jgi:hypothetical protein
MRMAMYVIMTGRVIIYKRLSLSLVGLGSMRGMGVGGRVCIGRVGGRQKRVKGDGRKGLLSL